VAKLPSVTSSIPRDLQQFILRVKETLEGNGPDAMVSARQLIAAGIADGVGNGGITSPKSDVVESPRAPSNVSAAGALATIIVSWNSPAYRGHAYSEIWAAGRTQAQTDASPQGTPIIGQAELVGMTAGNNFSHNIGGGAQRWYWVRFVNRNGLAGPYNLTDGTFGQTSQDPEYMLEVLTDAVTSSQLASTLLGNINTTFSQTSEPTQKADGSALVAGDIWVDTTQGQNRMYRYNGSNWIDVQDSGIAQAIGSASGAQGTADGKVTTYYQTGAPSNSQGTLGEGDLWVDTDDGNNLYRWNNTSSAWVDIQDGGISQAIQDAAGAQSTADGKITSYYQNAAPTNANGELSEGDLWTDTNDNDATYRWDADGGENSDGAWVRVGLASFADVTSSITDQVGYCELSIVSGENTAKSVSAANTTQTLCQTAQADASKPSSHTYAWKSDGAIASEVKTVTSSVDTNTATIQVQSDSIDGLDAQYTVKIDNNGAVAGFGLASTTTGAGNITSEFIVNADRFAIMRGASDTTAATVPFVVQATATTVNGEDVPAGVYMADAFIKNGTITNAKIGNLTADKITASLLNTVDFYGNTIAGSTIYLGGTITYTTDADGNNIGIASVASPQVAMTSTGANFATGAFVINNGSTNYTPFQVVGGVAYLNNAMIKDSTLSFAKVSDDIQSTDYSAGSNGWKIAKGGAMEMNNATFRGTLDIDSGSGSRLTVNDEKIEVFDGSSLRVRIGKLN
jgi:hypothetical protein